MDNQSTPPTRLQQLQKLKQQAALAKQRQGQSPKPKTLSEAAAKQMAESLHQMLRTPVEEAEESKRLLQQQIKQRQILQKVTILENLKHGIPPR